MATTITIAQKFAATIAILEGRTPEIEFTAMDAVEFLADRAEKSKSKPKAHKVKPETETARAAVATYMSEVGCGVTAKVVAEALDMSTSRASAALRYLAEQGIVDKVAGEKAKAPMTYTFIG